MDNKQPPQKDNGEAFENVAQQKKGVNFSIEQDDSQSYAQEAYNYADSSEINESSSDSLPSYIYIAYSYDAIRSNIIDEILRVLRNNNYQPWIDFEMYGFTVQWREIARPTIHEASVFLMVTSQRSIQSESVRWETTQAQQAGIPVILFSIDETPIPNSLVNVRHVELGADGNPDLSSLLSLLNSLQVQISIATQSGAHNDRVADEDQLEFKHYVAALSDLIISPDTEPPITLGIFGSWGTGKSFLLNHIRRRILRLSPYAENMPDIPPPNGTSIIQRLKSLNYRLSHINTKIKPIWQRPFYKVFLWIYKRSAWFPSLFFRDKSWGFLTRLRQVRQWIYLHWFDIEAPDTIELREVAIEVIDFNAWEYSATDIIWPGLVRKIMNLLESEVSLWTRYRTRVIRNFRKRVFWAPVWIIPLILLLLTGILLQISPELTLVGVIGLAGMAIKLIIDLFSNPVSQWITTLFETTDYGKRIGFMEEIRSDLELLEQGLTRHGKRVLIIVDDLDRCEPEKAVEMLQAVKLLLNFDSFIVILGIDARIITQAIEKHYEGLLGSVGASGYEYLDKIIQIPFCIPNPSENEVRKFIAHQMGGQADQTTTDIPDESYQYVDTSQKQTMFAGQSELIDALEPNLPSQTTASEEPNIIIQKKLLPFRDDERQIFQGLSPLLKPNPRHIKRLINVYRLTKSLAEYKTDTFIQENREIAIIWVVLCGQWPYAMSMILHCYNELLEDIAEAEQFGQPTQHFFPDNLPPLKYLYGIVEHQLAKDIREKLDYDPDLFNWLLTRTEAHVSWADLNMLRKYVVNFNPAVQVEIPISIELTNEQNVLHTQQNA